MVSDRVIAGVRRGCSWGYRRWQGLECKLLERSGGAGLGRSRWADADVLTVVVWGLLTWWLLWGFQTCRPGKTFTHPRVCFGSIVIWQIPLSELTCEIRYNEKRACTYFADSINMFYGFVCIHGKMEPSPRFLRRRELQAISRRAEHGRTEPSLSIHPPGMQWQQRSLTFVALSNNSLIISWHGEEIEWRSLNNCSSLGYRTGTTWKRAALYESAWDTMANVITAAKLSI